jgi:hypothetical protein
MVPVGCGISEDVEAGDSVHQVVQHAFTFGFSTLGGFITVRVLEDCLKALWLNTKSILFTL